MEPWIIIALCGLGLILVGWILLIVSITANKGRDLIRLYFASWLLIFIGTVLSVFMMVFTSIANGLPFVELVFFSVVLISIIGLMTFLAWLRMRRARATSQ
jgi:hypothetical protein